MNHNDAIRLFAKTLQNVERWMDKAAAHGAKTKLTLHQAVFETVTARNGHQEGWTSGLDRLAEYLAKA